MLTFVSRCRCRLSFRMSMVVLGMDLILLFTTATINSSMRSEIKGLRQSITLNMYPSILLLLFEDWLFMAFIRKKWVLDSGFLAEGVVPSLGPTSWRLIESSCSERQDFDQKRAISDLWIESVLGCVERCRTFLSHQRRSNNTLSKVCQPQADSPVLLSSSPSALFYTITYFLGPHEPPCVILEFNHPFDSSDDRRDFFCWIRCPKKPETIVNQMIPSAPPPQISFTEFFLWLKENSQTLFSGS